MKKIIFIIILIKSIFVYGQSGTELVTKAGKVYITQEDFKSKFGYTLRHDKSQSKTAVLDYYITLKLKSDNARQLKLDRKPVFVNRMLEFIRIRKDKYLKQDSFYIALRKQFAERMRNEIDLKQYILKDLWDSKAREYQAHFKKNPSFFDIINYAKTIKEKYIRAGDLPYEIEQEIYKNLKKGRVLNFRKSLNGDFIYMIVQDVRPYTGDYKFEWLLIKDLFSKGKEKIEALYKKALSGGDFTNLINKYSEDDKSKKRPFIQIQGNDLDKETYKAIHSLKKGEITPPFKTKYGWNIIKLLDHKQEITDPVIDNAFISSLPYQKLLKIHKVQVIDQKLNPVEYNQNILRILQNKALIKLLKNKKISKNEFEKKFDSLSLTAREPVIRFNNGLIYTGRNFLSDHRYALRDLYLRSESAEKELKNFIPAALFRTKLQLFDNIQDELNPKFKKEKALMEISLLNDLYDKYIEKKALADTVELHTLYDRIKNNYKWGKRVEVQIAYCSTDKKLAQEVKEQFKKVKSIAKMQQKFTKKNVYFRHVKREFSSKDLPKGYTPSKKIKIYQENGDYFVVKTIAKLPPQLPTYIELETIVKQKWKKIYLDKSIQTLKKSVKINQAALNHL